MANRLDWTPAGPYLIASTRYRNRVGIAFWRIRRLGTGRCDATDSTPFLLGEHGLERWPQFESAEMAKLWCEAADEKLAGGVR